MHYLGYAFVGYNGGIIVWQFVIEQLGRRMMADRNKKDHE